MVAFLAWRYLKRHNIIGGSKDQCCARKSKERSRAQLSVAERAIENMVKCPKCGAYVPEKGGHDCTEA